MQPRYCLPIIKSRQEDVLEDMDNNLAGYSYFEVWLDYIFRCDEAFVTRLAKLLGDKLILVFRRQNLDAIVMGLDTRLKILDVLHDTNVLVDLDITSQLEELEHIKKQGLKIKTIVSYHDYQQTTDSLQLETIIDTMDQYQPVIYKVATMCNNREDSLRLLQLLLKLKVRDRTAIIIGMGEPGTITRVFGALWGNEMTFAPLTAAEQSAPGQLTKAQMENIFKELEV